ncbi:MAG: AAA family ATPase [bacterium]|nr:AAA family ATPase [bacterium]
MYLKSIELTGFKSFGKKTDIVFASRISSIVGPNGSGKSNVAEAFRFVLGEQSMKSLRSKRGEDLIWGGSPTLPRSNRAGVKVVFDNSLPAAQGTAQAGTRLLDLDFNEVAVERIVYRDGENEYLLNGTKVRLKDVIRLLAGANIGGSGYQIISQGEADRILNASPRERREMVEDALGLKLYQHKKAESERKLEETASNIDKTKSLRREITPHLNFLRSQVQKIEKAREMKEMLAAKLSEYLAREHAWITSEDKRLSAEERSQETELKTLGNRANEARGKRPSQSAGVLQELKGKIIEREQKLSEARRESEKLTRELGRAEGVAEANTVMVEQIVAVPHVRQFAREVSEAISEALRNDDMPSVRVLLLHIKDRIQSFVDGLSGSAPDTKEESQQQVKAIANSLERVQKEETALAQELEALRAQITQVRDAGFAAERDLIELESAVREAQGKLGSVQNARMTIATLRQAFEDEVREGIALVGAAIHDWEKPLRQPADGGAGDEVLTGDDRPAQEKRRREIERLKIKIEESGIGNGDAVVREFNQTRERDEFLGRELVDLERSAASLKDIIVELEKTIDAKFTEGLKLINATLGDFFMKLFGGGAAKLEVEEPRLRRGSGGQSPKSDEDLMDEEEEMTEEEELYAGLSISVHLPRKKVHGLEVLSGGERALTSIALIFSMSQVNPPPFLVLDETDAALDEANSKRYADMIRELGSKSQLIVITHNRSTMAAAGELYGVTMGNDGVSKMLSVKLEEAEKVAK